MASIRKRTWTTPAGEQRTAWQADYKDQTGTRHRKAFETKRAAEEWLTRAKHEVQQGTHTPESRSITFAQAAESWYRRGQVEGLERSTLDTRIISITTCSRYSVRRNSLG